MHGFYRLALALSMSHAYDYAEMTNRMAMDLLIKTIAAQDNAAEQLKRCQDRGSDIFKSVRKHFGWNQPRMAKALNIHPTYLSKVENGKTPPGLDLLHALHAILANEKR